MNSNMMSAKLPLKIKRTKNSLLQKNYSQNSRLCNFAQANGTHEIITRWTLALAFAVLHNGRRLRKLSNHDQHNSIQIDKILHDRDFPSVHQEFSLCETNSLPFFKSLSHKWKGFLPNFKIIRCEILDKPHLA